MQNSFPQPSSGPANAPPTLGAQVPGANSEMPTQAGLSAYMNPMAQQLQSQGRGEDTMLVHMTPGEVKGLQQLAMAHGGSLTINPQTGLPEAGWLSKLLPTIIGAVLTPLTGGLINPLTAGLLVGGVETIRTGSLSKGLMAGLGAYGGAGLSAGLSAAGNAAAGAASKGLGAAAKGAFPGAEFLGSKAVQTAGTAAKGAFPGAEFLGSNAAQVGAQAGSAAAKQLAPVSFGNIGAGLRSLGQTAMTNPLQAARTFGTEFAGATSVGPTGAPLPGIFGKAATGAATTGLMNSLVGGMEPEPMQLQQEPKSTYAGPYTLEKQEVRFPTREEMLSNGGREFQFFTPNSPRVLDKEGKPAFTSPTPAPAGINAAEDDGYAKGGVVGLKDGSFVADARTVAEIGNGSSNAGHEILARMGGKPIRGPGDGVSDSVPARIGPKQPARVARDEVVFPPEAVSRIGGGSNKRGADKLYSMMDKAKAARRRAERGEDTGLRRGLM